MPRNPAGPSTLRNRNRVTNKTRLKVIKESIDADPIVLDEDEEKARVVSTAGVDAEDANEHHLQAVLSAAATRHQSIARSTRAAPDKDSSQPAAYIPTPDSTGIVQDYEQCYPPKRWHDPTSYVKSSDTLEECTSSALVGGFIYYMDERDKEWLDRNNEEARGEGTSAQGAVSGSTRSGRSSKAKGKDPEVSQPVVMSEDEFELVMAVFEKVTHEKTEFLHHGLEQGGPFPPFTDYQDTFSTKLQPDIFALYEVPSWVPEESKLLLFARAVYPYWRERRLERGGHPIIPPVNFDETDTKNESYICFRRREIKAVRKTRAQQATYSDRLLRLKHDLERALVLASDVKDRELKKQEIGVAGQAVWETRFTLIDLKRKYPTLGTKEDEELLHDKERVPKKAKTDSSGRPVVRLHPGSREPAVSQEPIMHPKAKFEGLQKQVEAEMAQRKEKDHHWEDVIDNPYQATPTPYPARLFKYIQSARSTHTPDASLVPPQRNRAARLRFGRGGRIHLDRRLYNSRQLPSDSDSDSETTEVHRRLQERWRFDDDDVPAVGPEGTEEQDRKLADDFDAKYLSHRMSLLSDTEYNMLTTDTSFHVTLSDGRVDKIIPYRPGVINSRAGMATPRTPSGSQPPSSRPAPNGTTPTANGSAIPAHSTPMPPPPTVPSLRISSISAMRASTPSATSLSPTVPSHRPSSSPARDQAHPNGLQEDPSSPVKTEQDIKMTVPSQANGSDPSQTAEIVMSPAPPQTSPVATHMSPPVPHKSPVQHTAPAQGIPNGHYMPTMNGYGAHLPQATPYLHAGVRANGYTPQMQTLKAASYPHLAAANQASAAQVGAAHVPIRTPTSYVGHASNADYSAQIALARQLQWQQAAHLQQQQQRHIIDASGVDNSALAPSLSPPARVPSSNGHRSVSLTRTGVPSPILQHAMGSPQGRASPANQHMVRLAPHSPSPHHLSPSLAASQAQSSPTRPPQQTIPSPSLQSRQAVGSSGAGY